MKLTYREAKAHVKATAPKQVASVTVTYLYLITGGHKRLQLTFVERVKNAVYQLVQAGVAVQTLSTDEIRIAVSRIYQEPDREPVNKLAALQVQTRGTLNSGGQNA